MAAKRSLQAQLNTNDIPERQVNLNVTSGSLNRSTEENIESSSLRLLLPAKIRPASQIRAYQSLYRREYFVR
jgi:hypothetical protein